MYCWHLEEFGYGKYLVHFSGPFGLAIGNLARLHLTKIETMASPNSPDMPPEHTRKV